MNEKNIENKTNGNINDNNTNNNSNYKNTNNNVKINNKKTNSVNVDKISSTCMSNGRGVCNAVGTSNSPRDNDQGVIQGGVKDVTSKKNMCKKAPRSVGGRGMKKQMSLPGVVGKEGVVVVAGWSVVVVGVWWWLRV